MPTTTPNPVTSPATQPRRDGRAAAILAALLEDIESGKLPPGSPLDERALATRFEVSRTPVREALQQLVARELVVITPRQGAMVARMSISKIRGLMELLGELESFAARLAARRVDETSRERLQRTLRRCEEAAQNGGAAEYAIANSMFHEAIFKGSRNEYLAAQLRQAHRLIQRYRVRDFQTPAHIRKSLEDHVAITQAICEGDEEAAARAMLVHVPAGSSGFSEFLATIPPSFFEAESS
jgi:DNA-binding GntR family transcriptional regulator